jgi:hypothetical protein
MAISTDHQENEVVPEEEEAVNQITRGEGQSETPVLFRIKTALDACAVLEEYVEDFCMTMMPLETRIRLTKKVKVAPRDKKAGYVMDPNGQNWTFQYTLELLRNFLHSTINREIWNETYCTVFGRLKSGRNHALHVSFERDSHVINFLQAIKKFIQLVPGKSTFYIFTELCF